MKLVAIMILQINLEIGLAGLRVGYGAFPLSIIEYLWRAKQPYNVSVAAEVSACAALQNPNYLEVPLWCDVQGHIVHAYFTNPTISKMRDRCAWTSFLTYLNNVEQKVKEALVHERERLFKLLKEVPFLNPYPSYSNFILCEVKLGMDAKKLKVYDLFNSIILLL